MEMRIRRRHHHHNAHRIITFTVLFVSYSIFQAVYSSEPVKSNSLAGATDPGLKDKIEKEGTNKLGEKPEKDKNEPKEIKENPEINKETVEINKDPAEKDKENGASDKQIEKNKDIEKTITKESPEKTGEKKPTAEEEVKGGKSAEPSTTKKSTVASTEPTRVASNETEPYAHPTLRPKRENCTAPAIEQFPKPLMGPTVRKHGGLIIHFLVAIFTFIGLAIVCDDYFVGSLDRICEELKLAPDVAGATFMAAGSSAPELATVIIGVFFAKDDIGISGVIGSAVFNIMFVISVCALFAGTVSHLNWWPMVRDCFFYALSILVMLCVIANDYISWPEALFMLIMYAVYCVVLRFNTPLERWAYSLNLPIKLPTKDEQAALVTYKVAGNVSAAKTGDVDSYDKMEGNTTDKPKPGVDVAYNASYANAGYNDEHQQPNPTWDPDQAWGAVQPVPEQPVWDPNASWDGGAGTGMKTAPITVTSASPQSPPQNTLSPQSQVQMSTTPAYYKAKEYNPDTAVNPLLKPSNPTQFQLVSYYVCLPIHFACRYTMPDCRSRFYVITFIMSMFWISFFSYFMVWMITIIGSTLGIPDTVMGLTFVAAGVSVPDALSSLAVIKEGYGDMAVSNAVGSNVFDILVCLGLPWLIQTAIIKPGSHVNVISKGLFYSTFSLLSTVVFLLVATHFNGWKLDRKYGIILMIWYILFITFASLYELNFFGNLHPPECGSDY